MKNFKEGQKVEIRVFADGREPMVGTYLRTIKYDLGDIYLYIIRVETETGKHVDFDECIVFPVEESKLKSGISVFPTEFEVCYSKDCGELLGKLKAFDADNFALTIVNKLVEPDDLRMLADKLEVMQKLLKAGI